MWLWSHKRSASLSQSIHSEWKHEWTQEAEGTCCRGRKQVYRICQKSFQGKSIYLAEEWPLKEGPQSNGSARNASHTKARGNKTTRWTQVLPVRYSEEGNTISCDLLNPSGDLSSRPWRAPTRRWIIRRKWSVHTSGPCEGQVHTWTYTPAAATTCHCRIATCAQNVQTHRVPCARGHRIRSTNFVHPCELWNIINLLLLRINIDSDIWTLGRPRKRLVQLHAIQV